MPTDSSRERHLCCIAAVSKLKICVLSSADSNREFDVHKTVPSSATYWWYVLVFCPIGLKKAGHYYIFVASNKIMLSLKAIKIEQNIWGLQLPGSVCEP